MHVLAEKEPPVKGNVGYLKAPSPVTVQSPLTTSPADILRELAVGDHVRQLVAVSSSSSTVGACSVLRDDAFPP